MVKYTFAMIKPDAVERNLVGYIISSIETIGQIVDLKMMKLDKETAREFYKEHKDRGFFNEMINDITVSSVVLICIKGDEDIVDNLRNLMGDTNPEEAKLGTIRKAVGVNIGRNSIHGSDSNTSADRELGIFFPNLKK
ncbi:MAG: nucleoside-diphosphate kinase [Pseudomonadota bacterium]